MYTFSWIVHMGNTCIDVTASWRGGGGVNCVWLRCRWVPMTCSELFDLGNITVAIKMPLRCCAAVGDSTARSSAVCIVHGRSRIALKTQPRCVKVHVFKCNFLTCKELTFRVVHPIFFFQNGSYMYRPDLYWCVLPSLEEPEQFPICQKMEKKLAIKK